MPKRVPLSAAELEIAKLVWKLGEVSARDVSDSLGRNRQIAFSTVQTYLTRLEKKGYVSARIDGRTKKFKSRVRPQSVISDAVRSFVNDVFDGETVPLVRQLISNSHPSPEEIAEIRELLTELEQRDVGD